MKLNPLQTRTLALLQEMASDPDLATYDEEAGTARVYIQLTGHHDHVHIGRFTVSTRFASGLQNPAVWKVLERKGLAIGEFPHTVTLTKAGLEYQTGIREQMLADSDH